MKQGIICQGCGVEAPCRHVEFHQNIGALLMRFHRKIDANLCKRCIHKHFWSMTSKTLLVGWLGMISLVVAPIFVINNLVRYLAVLGMPAVPADARPPMINQAVMDRFLPQAQAVIARVNAGEDLGDVARAVAPKLGITPGQLIKCLGVVAQQNAARTGANLPPIPLNPNAAPPPLPAGARQKTTV